MQRIKILRPLLLEYQLDFAEVCTLMHHQAYTGSGSLVEAEQYLIYLSPISF
jgi:hypothetical protein